MNIIELKDVSVKFDVVRKRGETLKESFVAWSKGEMNVHETLWALKDISFEVESGECFGVVGENASGKTTLLKVIGGVLNPSEGKVVVKGCVAPLLTLGVGFKPDLTAKENVYLYGSIMGLTKEEIDKRYGKIVNFSELHDFMNTKLKIFSDGMKLRLGFATAINVDADILLVDEVLTVGDGAFQKKCLEKFKELKREGKTIILVSHGLSAVREHSDRAIFLHKGQIKEIGPADKVVESYERHLRIKQLKNNNDVALENIRNDEKDVKIRDIKFFNKNGEECYLFKTGEQLQAQIKFESEPKAHLFMISFHDGGTELSLLSKNVKDCVAGFNVNALPLVAGDYRLSVSVWNGQIINYNQLFEFGVEKEKEVVKDVRVHIDGASNPFVSFDKEVLAFGDGSEEVFDGFKNGKTLLVFRNLDEAMRNCETGALFCKKKPIFAGKVGELLEKYKEFLHGIIVEKYLDGQLKKQFTQKC